MVPRILNVFFNILALLGLISLISFISFYLAEKFFEITNRKKFIAIPPGATIKEQLKLIGMSEKEFITKMDMPEEDIKKLFNGKIKLTTDIANRLENVIGIPTKFWEHLEIRYQEKKVEKYGQNKN